MTDADLPPQQPGTPVPPAQEHALLVAAASGDREAAGRLVDATYSAVYAALYRLAGGDRELAADLTQETYRKAWAALAGFNGRSRFSTWLYRIAYNTFLNHVRRPRPMLPLQERHHSATPDDAPDGEEMAALRQEAARLRRAVLDLPETLRLMITARYWGEVPVREIARAEGITQPAVRKRLKRALAMLARALESPS